MALKSFILYMTFVLAVAQLILAVALRLIWRTTVTWLPDLTRLSNRTVSRLMRALIVIFRHVPFKSPVHFVEGASALLVRHVCKATGYYTRVTVLPFGNTYFSVTI